MAINNVINGEAASSVREKINQAINGVNSLNSAGYATVQYITNLIANYYLKTETYSKAEVNNLIANIQGFQLKIISNIGEVVDSKVIYLLPISGKTNNSYSEYLYINGKPELMGEFNTSIDLSNYITSGQLTAALSAYVTSAAFNAAINNLANTYVAKESGKELIPTTALTKLNQLPTKENNDNTYVAKEAGKELIPTTALTKLNQLPMAYELTSNIKEVKEDGFFIADILGNVLAQFTINGFDAAKLGKNIEKLIARTNINTIRILGENIIEFSQGSIFTYTVSLDPLYPDNGHLVWSCSNGKIIASSNTSAKIEFISTGFTSIKCVSLANSLVYDELLVNVVSSLESEVVNIDYVFNNNDRGNIGGILIITSNKTRSYQLYWGVNAAALDGYDAILGDKTISLSANTPYELILPENMCIPSLVDSIIVVGDTTTQIPIPDNKITNYAELGTINYSACVISDIHTAIDDNNFSISIDLPNVYSKCSELGINLILTAGDNTDNGKMEQWDILNNYTDGLIKPYYSAGNHDVQNGGGDPATWYNYTQLPLNYTIEKGDSANNIIDASKKYGKLYDQNITNNDLYIILSVSSTSYTTITIGLEYREWLENILINNKSRRIFLISHIPLWETSGNNNNGYTGMPKDTDSYYIWLMPLLQLYSNVIWFHGHTHYAANVALSDPSLPFYDGELNNYAKMLHVPSLAYLRSASGSQYPEKGQYVIMDIYDNCIKTMTIETSNNKVQPMGCLIIKN